VKKFNTREGGTKGDEEEDRPGILRVVKQWGVVDCRVALERHKGWRTVGGNGSGSREEGRIKQEEMAGFGSNWRAGLLDLQMRLKPVGCTK
jgi:hypothetical protein